MNAAETVTYADVRPDHEVLMDGRWEKVERVTVTITLAPRPTSPQFVDDGDVPDGVAFYEGAPDLPIVARLRADRDRMCDTAEGRQAG